MTVVIRQMAKADKPAWDAYVGAHKEGSFCHRAGWKAVVEKGAGQKCPYLLAENAGVIVGVLPLTERHSVLFGDALISAMFAVYGGCLADTDAVADQLEAYAWQMAQDKGISSFELRTEQAREHSEGRWEEAGAGAATFRKPLKKKEDDILLDIPRKQRAVVRKSLKAGLTCSWERDLDCFYRLYAISVRNLGTPVFPRKLFRGFLDEFGDDVAIQVIRTPSGEAVASLMSFFHGSTVLPYYAGGTIAARHYGAHDFMYFQLMIEAAKRGCTLYDFGRSKEGTGPFKFKKNWGFSPQYLGYETRLADGAEMPDLSPKNKKFERMVNVWKKLPLPIANFVGPILSRHLG